MVLAGLGNELVRLDQARFTDNNFSMTTQVNVYEAKSTLSALLAKVAAGEEVVIARHGRPVARLVPMTERPKQREPGGWKGRVWIADDFDEPDEQMLSDWNDGPVEPQ